MAFYDIFIVALCVFVDGFTFFFEWCVLMLVFNTCFLKLW